MLLAWPEKAKNQYRDMRVFSHRSRVPPQAEKFLFIDISDVNPLTPASVHTSLCLLWSNRAQLTSTVIVQTGSQVTVISTFVGAANRQPLQQAGPESSSMQSAGIVNPRLILLVLVIAQKRDLSP